MFSTWFATLGAAFPAGMAGRRRSAAVADVRGAPATSLAPAPAPTLSSGAAATNGAAPMRARVVDPIDLKVVPFVPGDGGATQRRAHPRVLNPFRAFPNRGAVLFEMMNPRDPRD